MAYTERLVGESKTLTRRQAIKGGVVAGISVLFAAALPAWAATTLDSAKKYIMTRTDALYKIDEASKIRVSHLNPEVLNMYTEFLSPGEVRPAETHLSHRLCHTVYGNDIKAHIKELKAEPLHELVAHSKKGA